MDLKEKIRSIEDFPEKGVIFRDITTLLKDGAALREAVNQMQEQLKEIPEFDLIVGPESRGFIFSMPIAYNLKKGFVPIRKRGKLPAEVISKEYALEYGVSALEVHKDAVKKGQKVVIIDDLLATGGTAKAIVDMMEEIGAEVVGLSFLVELDDLNGRNLLEGYRVNTLLHY